MSVEKIRALQQGSEDLSSAIAHLTGYHSCQIDDHKRCRAVCEAIHNDDADFATLDAEHYLRLLREIRINDRALGRTDFRESIPKEIHPWRRWFARSLDYGLWGAIVSYFYIVILRVRPIPGDFADAMISVLAMALFIPVEALLLSKFGTTPGKFAMGIRLESIQGGNLTFREAFTRSYGVYFLGVGCNIPIVEFAVKIVRYCRLTGRTLRRFARYDELEGPQDMPWDEVTEIIYVNQGFKRGAAAALILVLSFGINLFVVLDGIKPKYRGDELTVAQFADNYNAYLSWYQEDAPSYSKLQEDGSHYPIPDHTAVVQFNDSRQNRQMEFDYELEGESIQAVSITHDWGPGILLTAPER